MCLATQIKLKGYAMRQYDITVKIRVTVEECGDMTEVEWASHIAKSYAEMALHYSRIGADKILRVDVEEV